MSSIAGIFHMGLQETGGLEQKLTVMNTLQKHRGPDGAGVFVHDKRFIGFAHRSLNIAGDAAAPMDAQPIGDEAGNWAVLDGALLNARALANELGVNEHSDAALLLAAYRKWGEGCALHLKGAFAFALWDEKNQTLLLARDRVGIKPLYYYINDNQLFFASEIKALLPFIQDAAISPEGLKDYLTFQFCLSGKTLFKGVYECPPAHRITVRGARVDISRWWQLYYALDWDHSEKYFTEKLEQMITDSVKAHTAGGAGMVGGYVSGGIDSSVVSALASKEVGDYLGFTGKFAGLAGYDESAYARELADMYGFKLLELDITADDFLNNIQKVIYHLDQPVAGPGSFNQYMTSAFAAQHRKIVLGGQGGDEIFGGYTRYLVAYFEQCIRGAIDGTMHSGKFIVTYESIIPNLITLRNYKPMIKSFFKEGLFESIDRRYFRLINRAPDAGDCFYLDRLGSYDPFEAFSGIFNAENAKKASYFDRMLHFDFKTSLPALLMVEDRMGMAFGLESRVPFLDHELIEFVATMPANFKLKDGNSKFILKESMGRKYLPESILNRKDKMGFPAPFVEWVKGPAREFVMDALSGERAASRPYIDNKRALTKIQGESAFGRNIWGLLCLELWQREFLDKAREYRDLVRP